MIPIIFLLISSIWLATDDGTFVEWTMEYGHIQECGSRNSDYGHLIKGCYDPANKTLMFVEEYMWDQTMYGMTIWEHEVRHAMGQTHAEMEWWYFKGQYR